MNRKISIRGRIGCSFGLSHDPRLLLGVGFKDGWSSLVVTLFPLWFEVWFR